MNEQNNQYEQYNTYGQYTQMPFDEKIRKKNDKLAKKLAKKQAKREAKKAGTYRMSIPKRIGVVILTAVLFGTCAGGAFLGVKYVGERFFDEDSKKDDKGLANVEAGNLENNGKDNNGKENAGQLNEKRPPVSSTVDGFSANVSQNPLVAYDVSDVAEMCMPSVISIVNDFTETYTIYGQRYEQPGQSSGSGIIIGQSETELLLVTNYHVVEGADKLTITFIDKTTAEASIKGYEEEMDIAVIAIQLSDLTDETLGNIAIAVLGDSDTLKVGEAAIAIGNALGYGQSVTLGVISALNRELEIEGTYHTLLQTDAAINPGNSGGALLNTRGEVIGINSNKIGGSVVEGMGYAIPISLVKDLIEELSLKETLIKVEDGQEGYLGIYGMDVSEDVAAMYDIPKGVYISQPIEGGAADAAGLLRGDIITALGGNKVRGMTDLTNLLQYYAVGTEVEVTIQRKENGYYVEKSVKLILGSKME